MSGTKVAMAHSHSFQSGALSFMSCTSGRESSPMDENDSHQTSDFKAETKKKRFHPLRNLRRMFRRKSRRSSISADSYQASVPDNPEIPSTNLEQRSCSTSRLQEENLTQNLIRNSRLNPGLSLSHDSIFTPDKADSGLSSSDLENSSLSITVLTPPSKECPIKSQSSCSETSLLSIGSSEVELSPVRSGKSSDLDLGVTTYKLSHSAAKHKMAVKPRRNHGAPRSRRRTLTSKSPLPTTLEVSEEGTTGRSSPHPEPPQPPPASDKRISETKISWSQITIESNSNDTEVKSNEVPKLEEETDVKEDEATNQKAESFFGRFLSRRSEKKKKLHVETLEEKTEEKPAVGHFAKKLSKSNEGKGAGKSPNRRQRVEPVEIPAGPQTGSLGRGEKNGQRGTDTSSSVSPPKNHWPSQTTSRSISPPKAVWPETFCYYVKTDLSKNEIQGVSPIKESTENTFRDFKNPNFVKELADSVSLFIKDESGNRKKNEEEEEEAILKVRRQQSEDETPRKTSISVSDMKKMSNSTESIGSGKSMEVVDSVLSDNTAKIPKDTNSITINSFDAFSISQESVHDGYENIQIIELVKQETKNFVEDQSEEARKKETEKMPEKEKISKVETENAVKETEVKKMAEKESEVVMRRVKPLVSEKPKDLKRPAGPECGKLSMSRVEPKSSEAFDEKTEKIVSKSKSTLVERRKSELMLLTEAEEKDWKAKIKPLKKQTSFSEKECGNPEASLTTKEDEKTEATTEEVVEEVVLRKKSVANDSEEQPELMKVFARRSLKVKESEKIVDDMQKSRDSDKENEMVESPKEDRKKGGTKVEGEEKKEADKDGGNRSIAKGSKATAEVKISVTSLKPEVANRKFVFQKYTRSLSENNGKSREEIEPKKENFILEENHVNNMKNETEMKISRHIEEKDGGAGRGTEEDEEETGFKRIQQRKAEWERRAQQGAK